MKKPFFLVTLMILLLLPVAGWATTYTVGSSGCDYTTIQGAIDGEDLGPNDEVEIRADTPGGTKTYNEAITIYSSDGGDSSGYVTIRGREGDTITIDADGLGDKSCILLYGTQYIKVKNLTLTHSSNRAGITIHHSSYIELENIIAHDCDHYGIRVMIGDDQTSEHVSISNCESYNNDYGIYCYVSTGTTTGSLNNLIIQYCNIHDNSEYGIRIRHQDSGTIGNISAVNIHHCVITNSRGAITLAETNDSVGPSYICHNEVYNNDTSSAIQINYSSYVTIADNLVHDNPCTYCTYDNLGINIDWSSHHVEVLRNIVYGHTSIATNQPWGESSASNSTGIHICCGAHDNIVAYNLCYDNITGIHVHGEGGGNKIYNNILTNNCEGIHLDIYTEEVTNEVKNNIIANNTRPGVSVNYDLYQEKNAFIEDYNFFGASPSFSSGYTLGAHSIQQDPLLTPNYHLSHNSPCINAGTFISGFHETALDIDGQPILGTPDIGCDERKALWWDGRGWHIQRMY